MPLEIEEKDESGALLATYIASQNAEGRSRVDIIVYSMPYSEMPFIDCVRPVPMLIRNVASTKADRHLAEGAECVPAGWIST